MASANLNSHVSMAMPITRLQKIDKFREMFNTEGFVSLNHDFFVDPSIFKCFSSQPHIVYKNPGSNILNDTGEKVIVVLLSNLELNTDFILKISTVNKQKNTNINSKVKNRGKNTNTFLMKLARTGIVMAEIMYKLIKYHISPHNVVNYYYKHFIQSPKKPLKINCTHNYSNTVTSHEYKISNNFVLEIQETFSNSVDLFTFFINYSKSSIKHFDEYGNEKLMQTFIYIFFQIVYNLYVYNNIGIIHNDLTENNIIIYNSNKEIYFNKYILSDESKTTMYLRFRGLSSIEYNVCFIDFQMSAPKPKINETEYKFADLAFFIIKIKTFTNISSNIFYSSICFCIKQYICMTSRN